MAGLGAALAEIVGTDNLFAAAAIEPRYLEGETGDRPGRPAWLVRPADTDQVAAVLALCNRHGQPVVTQGGRTGLTGAAIPQDGELILSLERMRAIIEIDRAAATMTVEAGVPLAVAQEAAAGAGFLLAVDIGSRGSCTIGGMIATNAGGNQVLRYGMMRDQVLGLEAVLADGTRVGSLGKMIKDNAGYDLKQLFIGSEGTLGVVTRAVLRLRPAIGERGGALVAVPSVTAALQLLHRFQGAAGIDLTAFEAMWPVYYDTAAAVTGSAPVEPGHALYLLVETAGPAERVEALFADCFEAGLVTDAALARSIADLDRFWSLRDAIGPIGRTMRKMAPYDISVSRGDIDAFVAQAQALLPGALYFGHIADSNLHVVLDAETAERHAEVDALIYTLVGRFGGSVSAEHGIGLHKRRWLGQSRGETDIALMRRLRAALDPMQILNRDRVLARDPAAFQE